MIEFEKNILETLTSYLLRNNWIQSFPGASSFSIWNHDRFPDLEITLPIASQHKRTKYLVSDALEQLSSIGDESIEQIYKKITVKDHDQVSLRAIASDVSEGSINFEDGLNLYTSTQNIFKDICKSLPKFEEKSKHIAAFFNNFNMGQTQIGSFVINLNSPLYNANEKESMSGLESDSSLGRKINTQLFRKLESISNILNENSTESKYTAELLTLGISKNTSESIIKLFGNKSHRDIDFSVNWSEKEDIPATFNKKIVLHSSNAEKLRKYNSALEHKKNDKSVALTGQIESLSREYKNDIGKAKLRTKFKNKDVSISFSIADELYTKVANAHAKKYPVTVNGEVTSISKSKRLYATFTEVYSINVKENGELDI